MSGINHFTKLEAMTNYAKYKKMPVHPEKFGVLLSGLMILVGGLFILFGYYADLGAILIAAFLLFASIMFHNFWSIEDAATKQTEEMGFMKNMALLGASLMIFALVAKHSDLSFGWVISKGHLALFK